MPMEVLGLIWQLPPWQTCWLVQDWHGSPPEPQSLELWPERQLLPSQQPGQLPGPHWLVLTQTP
jgi:hypothetical protein